MGHRSFVDTGNGPLDLTLPGRRVVCGSTGSLRQGEPGGVTGKYKDVEDSNNPVPTSDRRQSQE